MARPKKPVNYEEELEKLDMQIAKHKNAIQVLEEQKEKFLQEKKNLEISSLYDAVLASGKKVEDVVAMLRGRSKTDCLNPARQARKSGLVFLKNWEFGCAEDEKNKLD